MDKPEQFLSCPSPEYVAALDAFEKRFTSRFEGLPLLNVIPLLFIIDVDTWTFPDYIKSYPLSDVIEFLENDTGLRDIFRQYCKEQSK